MTRTHIDVSDEQKLLINTILYSDFDKALLHGIKSTDLEVSYGKLVLRWIRDYFEKYHQAPGRDLVQLWFRERASQFSESEIDEDTIKLFLKTLNNKYLEMGDTNVRFQIDEATEYLNACRAHSLGEILHDTTTTTEEKILAISKFQLVEASETQELYTRIGDLEITPPDWLVQGMFEKDSTCLLFGDPGVGKSFLALDIGASIATGQDFHTCGVPAVGPVVYICGEGRSTIGRRCKAWAVHNEIDLAGHPFYIFNNHIQLLDAKSLIPLAATLEEIASKDGPPALLIIDTWNRLQGGDENSNTDASKAIAALDRLCKPYECGRFIVHHCGHGEKGRARGASALNGAVDNAFRVDRESDGKILLTPTKCKDGREPEPMNFDLIDVDLGIADEHGQMIRSATLLVDGDYERPKKIGLIGKNMKLALELIDKLKGKHKSVDINEWRTELLGSGMSKSIYSQLKRNLVEKDLIGIDDNRKVFRK